MTYVRKMNFKNSLSAKIILALFSIGILISGLVISDRLYGEYFAKNTKELIYPPCSEAHHKSSEFDITVKINSLGFRDYKYPIEKRKKKRIAVIGDSFTFGWGVNLQDCWVKITEKQLNEDGFDVEILNLGKGGASPADYLQTTQKTIPLLKPDLVVVSVLQANDLHQLIHAYDSLPVPKIPEPKNSLIAEKIHTALVKLFPNFVKRLSVQNIDISAQWKREATALKNSFAAEQQKRFDSLDEKVKIDFSAGLLNPWLIHQAVYYPDYFVQTLDTTDLDVVIGISAMGDFMAEIKSICEQNNSEMIVLSIPNLPYSSEKQMHDLEKIGFNIPDSIYTNPIADETTKMAASEAGVDFFSISDEFRKHNNDTLFYPLDGHLTKKGNAVVASSVKNILSKKLTD